MELNSKRKVRSLGGWIAWGLLCAAFFTGCDRPRDATNPRLTHAIYVWQRVWNDDIRQAISQCAGMTDGFVALAGETMWVDGRPQVVRVSVDYSFLKTIPKPVGLAIRIGEHRGRFSGSVDDVGLLEALAAGALADAKSNGLQVAELQIDFDCAESQLADYQYLVRAIKARIRPLPLVLTVLPSWLDNPHFAELARAADGFVLQVHSLEKPAVGDMKMTLCDPRKADRWVRQAGGFGVPFRVALPTYGYIASFARDGRLLGVSAEGPLREWKEQVCQAEVRADPIAMGDLVRMWTARPPRNMQGVIWYRLPALADRLNWRRETLAAIIEGRIPLRRFALGVVYPEPSLAEIELANDGEVDGPSVPAVALAWGERRLVGADGLAGYECVREGDRRAVLNYTGKPQMGIVGVGEKRKIGWLRFDGPTEVKADAIE